MHDIEVLRGPTSVYQSKLWGIQFHHYVSHVSLTSPSSQSAYSWILMRLWRLVMISTTLAWGQAACTLKVFLVYIWYRSSTRMFAIPHHTTVARTSNIHRDVSGSIGQPRQQVAISSSHSKVSLYLEYLQSILLNSCSICSMLGS